jgi:hypothetical protein
MNMSDELNELRTIALAELENERIAYLDEEEYNDRIYDARREDLISYCRPMRLWEYAAWLTGFMQSGGKPTHFYDYNTPSNWFTANEDFTVAPLYGSRAINIIVPVGVRFLGGPTGHNKIYISTNDGRFLGQEFHDHKPNTNITVPVYMDTETLN